MLLCGGGAQAWRDGGGRATFVRACFLFAQNAARPRPALRSSWNVVMRRARDSDEIAELDPDQIQYDRALEPSRKIPLLSA